MNLQDVALHLRKAQEELSLATAVVDGLLQAPIPRSLGQTGRQSPPGTTRPGARTPSVGKAARRQASLADHLYDRLTADGRTEKELAQFLGLRRRDCRRVLARLVTAGRIRLREDGLWVRLR